MKWRIIATATALTTVGCIAIASVNLKQAQAQVGVDRGADSFSKSGSSYENSQKLGDAVLSTLIAFIIVGVVTQLVVKPPVKVSEEKEKKKTKTRDIRQTRDTSNNSKEIFVFTNKFKNSQTLNINKNTYLSIAGLMFFLLLIGSFFISNNETRVYDLGAEIDKDRQLNPWKHQKTPEQCAFNSENC